MIAAVREDKKIEHITHKTYMIEGLIAGMGQNDGWGEGGKEVTSNMNIFNDIHFMT